MANETTQSTKVVTGRVRASYAHVWEPQSIDGSDPKYSISLIIPKSDKVTIAKIEAAIAAAIEAGKTKLADKGGRVNKAILKLPLRDGDLERPDDEAYADSYFIGANSKQQPGVVDKNLNPILDKSEFYSGCYCRASVNFYAFNTSGNKGIAAGLQNLQKLADGLAFSGRSNAEDDFSDNYDYEDDLLD